MSKKRKDPIPHLIFDRRDIARRTGKYPQGKTWKPVCSECDRATKKQYDEGYYKPPEKKRGRPPKDEKKNDRREHIGYWCKRCRLFYYLDGSADYRERPLQERDQNES